MKALNPKIRTVIDSDAEVLAEIYNYYILNTIVSFEQEPISGTEMLQRIKKVQLHGRWIVAEIDGKVMGCAYSDLWNNRCSYEKTREVSVYLDQTAIGHGIGRLLYQDLIEDAREKKYHTLIGGISLPNKASVGLHEYFGFTQAAHYKEVGFKFGSWIDVGYWQLLLDSA